MFTIKDILETNQMITQNNLDVRTTLWESVCATAVILI